MIDGLIMSGATNVVMSPGAQAAPLMMACRANAKAKITVIIDERSAAFFALGLARATQTPTIIICTSGSAVGQLYPAIMEAAASQVPLIILAADRAPEKQDCGAAQATDQIRVFGMQVRAAHHLPVPDASIESLPSLAARIIEQSLFPNPGPVYVNQPFREPLYAKTLRKFASPRLVPMTSQPLLQATDDDILHVTDRVSGRPGLIVCGSQEIAGDFAMAVQFLATAAGAPIIADPLSGLRFGPSCRDGLVSCADSLPRALAFADDCHPEWVISFGGPLISQAFSAWLKKEPVADYIVVDNSPRWTDPLKRATRMVRAEPAAFCRALAGHVSPAPAAWRQRFVTLEQRISTTLRHGKDGLLWEAPIIASLLTAAPEGGAIFSANSMSIRDFDTFSGSSDKPLRVLGNRGVNGIDGSIATLLGIASRSDRTTLGMIGDVAFAHDMGSLQIANHLDVVLVVLNNGGGGIFDYQGAVETREYLDFLCPPTVDVAAVAGACRWHYWRADTAADFDSALGKAMSAKGCRLIEAVIDRKASVGRHHAFWKDVSKTTVATESVA
ncbi:2-succinyl-5-enolpyruvyl-6-hydroxy-3-cyclohexene-1-carboxylic-acid synthase [Telmatospirillum sp.]|uniref:2-succinyl-5-enolpyruvyl-6-hydroxy-3- cyclohexene-1-carboxylic-acid synthase n=1 Tax=Telmatospirillum sp. TaxID=2079197 RepID=UPI00285244F3|nr:2-succinyl-5-enolpyruvyl-6-hydroxy-3-cyclohexene-1-carboxylic-acid synthase [Telmatospirillum sp.]MDR3436259.1 2-succinyl-5-enolpyruvyl-6-hydroxy-3-cyclohexene-1-carboxylic-acid synthase [Telmatospirillum sp.]